MKKKNTTWKVKRKKEKSRLPKIAIIIIMIIIYIILPFRKQRVWESGAMQTCCCAVMFATSLRVWTFELRAALFFTTVIASPVLIISVHAGIIILCMELFDAEKYKLVILVLDKKE